MPEYPSQSKYSSQGKKTAVALAVVLAVALAVWWFIKWNPSLVSRLSGSNSAPENQIYIPSILHSLSGIIKNLNTTSFVMEIKFPDSKDNAKFITENRTVNWSKNTKFLMSDGYPNDKTPTKAIKFEDVKIDDAVVVTSDENIRTTSRFTAQSVVVYSRSMSSNTAGDTTGFGPVIGELTGVNGKTLTVVFRVLPVPTPSGKPISSSISPGTWSVELVEPITVKRVIMSNDESLSAGSTLKPSALVSTKFASLSDIKKGVSVGIFVLSQDNARKKIISNSIEIIEFK